MAFITIDEKSCQEKRKAYYYLIQAHDLNEAHKVMTEKMKGTVSDYEIEAVSLTAIVDIIEAKSSEE